MNATGYYLISWWEHGMQQAATIAAVEHDDSSGMLAAMQFKAELRLRGVEAILIKHIAAA